MGNVYTVNEILFGALSDRPDADRNIILYIDKDTGKASLSNGTTWDDFGGASYPGVTSPGSGQLAAPGGITVGAGGQFSQFTGALAILSTQTDYSNGNPPLSVEQDGTLDSGDGSMQQIFFSRHIDRNGRATGNPVLEVLADDSTHGTHPVPANEQVFRSSSALGKHVTTYADGSMTADGGIGCYGTTPPASQPDLTIQTSTITDAAAKAAIQALISVIFNAGFAGINET